MINAAITAAIIAASQEEETEEAILGKLRNARAASISTAIRLDVAPDKQELLDEVLAGGAVAKTADGRFYLNERVLSDRNESQGFMVLLTILIAGSLIASGVALALSLSN
jgi:hypothetical protein